MLTTLRDVPAEAEIISHQLLIRGGFIKRVTSGIYAYMPLMWKVLQKITTIVQEEMDKKDCLQTLLPQLHPSDLWQESGRWQGYTAGEGIMFHLKDRQNKELGLGPTHEEVITKIVGETLHSYKQLPITLYQIQTKFRDEIRPRFGLMRSREFIMKDAYSFHKDEQSLKLTYKEMDDAYKKIFSRCGLKTVCVDADSGAIGGSASQEFMVTADSGEDCILISSDGSYAANQEKAISKYSKPITNNFKVSKIIETPNQNSIKELCQKQDLHPSQVVKVILMIAILESDIKQPILISLRGDQELNEVKLINSITKELNKEVIEVYSISNNELSIEGLKPLPFGSIGPDLNDSVLKDSLTWNKKFIRIADFSVSDLKDFVCGANQINKHRVGINWSSIGGLPSSFDLRKSVSGDKCIHDENQVLKECRGIEVGHIFQLGCKYSKKLNAMFTNEKGIQEAFWMGCYGIGVSRLAQASIEQNNDDSGIIWPLAISPYEVIITIANVQDEHQKNLGEELYKILMKNKADVLIDDRNERAGIKFKDADLIGIPWRIVVGRDAINRKVELFERATKRTILIDSDKAINQLLKEINTQKSSI
tara:strand:+ start:17720 stop:19498 length:1779 start_codon:yes stop_codon:yes gene_type:complete